MKSLHNIPEIEKEEEIREKLREEYIESHCYDWSLEQEANWFIERMDLYAQQKIDLIFEQENNRNQGKIKVRTENGIAFIKRK